MLWSDEVNLACLIGSWFCVHAFCSLESIRTTHTKAIPFAFQTHLQNTNAPVSASFKSRHFITPQYFLLFLCGIIWSLLFKTEVEQMNPSVLTFSCQQCFSVRWNKLPSPFIFYNQRRTAEHTHSPACCLCQRLFYVEREVFVTATSPALDTGEGLFWFLLSFLASLHLPPPFSLHAQLTCSPFSVGKKVSSEWHYFLKDRSNIAFLFPHCATQS